MRRAIWLAVPYCLGVLSCGDEDGAAPKADADRWESRLCEGRADGELMVAGMYTFSAGAATADSVEKAILLALDTINSTGGALGQEVGLISCDHELDVDRARAQLREVAEHPGFVGLVGPDTSQMAADLVRDIRLLQIVAIGPSLGAPSISFFADDGFLFRTRPSNQLVADIASAVFLELDADRVFGVYRDDEFGVGNRGAFESVHVGNGGAVGHFDYDPTTTGFEARAVDAAVDFEPEGLYLIGFSQDRTAVLKRAAVAQWQGPPPEILVGAAVGFDPGAGDFVEGVRLIDDTIIDNPRTRRFKESYEARWGSEPELFSDDAFDATMNLVLAAEVAGRAGDGEAIRDALPLTHSGKAVTSEAWAEALELIAAEGEVNYEGLVGPLDFDDNGDATGATMTEFIVTDGKLEEIRCWAADLGTCD